MVTSRISLQTFTVRMPLSLDVPKTLSSVASHFRNVEIAGTGRITAEEFARHSDECGVTVVSTHAPCITAASEEHIIGALLRQCRAFPSLNTVVFMFNPDDVRSSVDRVGLYRRYGDMIESCRSELASALKNAGIERKVTVAYHCYSVDLRPLPSGQQYVDILLEANPNLSLQVDTYFAARSGIDVTAFLKKHASRIRSMHLNDIDSKHQQLPVGTGILPWEEILTAAGEARIQDFFIEHDINGGQGLQEAIKSKEYLKRLSLPNMEFE